MGEHSSMCRDRTLALALRIVSETVARTWSCDVNVIRLECVVTLGTYLSFWGRSFVSACCINVVDVKFTATCKNCLIEFVVGSISGSNTLAVYDPTLIQPTKVWPAPTSLSIFLSSADTIIVPLSFNSFSNASISIAASFSANSAQSPVLIKLTKSTIGKICRDRTLALALRIVSETVARTWSCDVNVIRLECVVTLGTYLSFWGRSFVSACCINVVDVKFTATCKNCLIEFVVGSISGSNTLAVYDPTLIQPTKVWPAPTS